MDCKCKNLPRVTFGSSSSLERIGDLCFDEPELVKVIPPSVKRHVGRIVKTETDQLGVPIHIKPLTGSELRFPVQLTDTIEDLKAKIQEKRGIPPNQQRIKFKGQLLEEGKTLHDYSIQEYSTLLLIELQE